MLLLMSYACTRRHSKSSRRITKLLIEFAKRWVFKSSVSIKFFLVIAQTRKESIVENILPNEEREANENFFRRVNETHIAVTKIRRTDVSFVAKMGTLQRSTPK